MDEYPSNSVNNKTRDVNKPSPERPKVAPVTNATKSKKKNKFSSIFLAEDIDNIKSYIIIDVLIPSIRKAIYDVITEGASAFLGTSSSKKDTPSSKISYRSFYESENKKASKPVGRQYYSYDDVEIPTRGGAEDVLISMGDLIRRYGVVSVLDLYDLAGVTSDNYTDADYGWTDIRNASVSRLANGRFKIILPKAMPLN